jgi:hypothetical protein
MAELVFPPQAGKEHGAQRSGPRSGNEVFALLGRTGTGRCLVAVPDTSLSTAGVFGFARSNGSDASNVAGTGLFSKPAVRALLPVRLRRSLRLRAPSPSASAPSAADAPGRPKHHVAPRGVRRYRRNASRPQSGAPTACSHLGPDLGPPSSSDAITSWSPRIAPMI